jgi:type II secretion system protein N
VKARLWRIAKLAVYPLFYLLCLVVFFYLTFPFSALRTRLLGEFERSQHAGARGSLVGAPGKSPMQLEIKDLGGYWLSGVELRGAKLILPNDKRQSASMPAFGKVSGAADEAAPEPSVIAIEQAHARVRLLPLLIGRVRFDFGAKVFGGEVSGTLPYGGNNGDVNVELEKLQLSEVQPLRALLGGLPLLGTVNGQLQLAPREGKFGKADGSLELKLERVVVGDGKAQLQGVALPAAQIGDITITGTAKDGLLKIAEISAAGRDLELQGEGKIRLKEPWVRSQADIYLKFRFTDAYRDHDDATRGLLGSPGSKFPAAIDYNPTIKRAKQEDGFYAWHIHGALNDLSFDPQGTPAKSARTSTRTPSGKGMTGRGTTIGKLRRGGGASDDSGEESPAPADNGAANADAPRVTPPPEAPAPGAAPPAPPPEVVPTPVPPEPKPEEAPAQPPPDPAAPPPADQPKPGSDTPSDG